MNVSNHLVFVLEEDFRSIFPTQNCMRALRRQSNHKSNDGDIQEHRVRSIRAHDPGDGR